MANIPAELCNELSDKLDALSAKGRNLVETAIYNAEWRTTAELRDIAIEALDIVCEANAETATVLASDFYDDVRTMALGNPLGVVAESSYEREATEEAVRGMVNSIEDGGFLDSFAKACGDRADYVVKRSAGDAVYNLGYEDDEDVRFARVPSGIDTCDFCIMLASRGFAYISKKSAGDGKGHYHSNCRCRIVPGFKGSRDVEGYDPEYYRRIYKRLKNAKMIHPDMYSGSASDIKIEASSFDSNLKKAWAKHKVSGSSKESYDSSYRKLVMSMSPDGLLDIEDFANIEGKELQVGVWFANAGRKTVFRNPDVHKLADGDTSDVSIDGETWDFKRIESSNVSKIPKRVFEHIDTQGPRFVIDLSISDIDRRRAELKIADILEDSRVDEIILIKSGNAKLFIK